METSRLGYWLQVAANIGILAGLVLVGVQINQNSELLRYQILFQERHTSIEAEHSLLGENPALVFEKSLEDPLNLSTAEMRVMEAYYWTYFERVRRQYELRDLLGDEWKRSVMSAPFIFGSPLGRAYWADIRGPWASNEIGKAIDEALEGSSMNRNMEHYDRIKASLPEFLAEAERE